MILNYWLAMRTGTEVPPSRVFNEFRNYVGNTDLSSVMSGRVRKRSRDLYANYRDYETAKGRLRVEEKLSRSIIALTSCKQWRDRPHAAAAAGD